MSFGEMLFAATRANLEHLPELPGVFTLYRDGMLIFVGHADGGVRTIKSQIVDHKEGRRGACTQSFDYYTREVTTNVVCRYRELMEQHARKYRRWPKGNADCCGALSDDTPERELLTDTGLVAAYPVVEAENAHETLNVLSESAPVDFMFSDEFYDYSGVAKGEKRISRGAAVAAR